MKHELRWYQVKAKAEIRAAFKRGVKKVLLIMPTGAGKTTVFSSILSDVVGNKKNGSMVVKGRLLVDQASQRLTRESVPHGVRMANHWNKKHSAPIQVCSIDTLLSRGDFPKSDILVIDEAHLFTTEACRDFMTKYPDAYVLAVTATAYGIQSLRHLADEVIEPVTIQTLIDEGFLVNARYYAPSKPDLTGVRTSSLGDYVTSELQNRMRPLTGDLVQHWKSLAEGRPTLCFAVSVDHSLSIVAQFNAVGIKAEHVEASTPAKEREAAIKRLESGETKILSNVGILCTGVDIPPASCILMARPTQSLNLFLQILGRGTRPFPGKDDFIVLDHAGNCLRHGFMTDEHEVFLDGRKKVSTGPQSKECKKCYRVFVGFACPECGFEPPVKTASVLLVEDGTLEEMRAKSIEDVVLQYILKKREEQKKKGYKKQWLWFQVRNRFGYETAMEVLPKAAPRGYVEKNYFPGGLK